MDLRSKVTELPQEKIPAFLKWQVSRGHLEPVLGLFPEITSEYPEIADALEAVRARAAQKEAMLSSAQPTQLDVAQRKCDACGAVLHQALQGAELVVCNYCGSRVGEAGAKKGPRPEEFAPRSFLRLGMVGRFDGKPCQVVGRTVWFGNCREWDSEDGDWESTLWDYEEWLLLTEDRAFWYLSHDDEGLQLAREYDVRKPNMPDRNDRRMDLGEGTNSVDEHGSYNLKYMEGEFGWRQELGERVRTAEYSRSNGAVISAELRTLKDGGDAEVEFFRAREVEPRELLDAFEQKRALAEFDRRAAVASTYRSWSFAGMAVAMLLTLIGCAQETPGQTVFERAVTFAAIDDGGTVLGPFRLESVGRPHRIQLISSIRDNSWAWVGAELLDGEQNSINALEHEFWRESGYDSDGSWSERSVVARQHFRLTRAGDYYLRLQLEEGTAGGGTVRAYVFENTSLRRYHFVAAIIALVLGLSLFRTTRTDDLIRGEFSEP